MKIKVLSIKQPWAWLIVNGFKDIENRTWATNYRGPMLIHAGKSFDYSALYALTENDTTLAAGRLVIDFFGIGGKNEPRITKGREQLGALVGYAFLTGIDYTNWNRSPWAEKNLYHWHMEHGQPLQKTVSMSGRLGLFEIDWTPDIIYNEWRRDIQTGNI